MKRDPNEHPHGKSLDWIDGRWHCEGRGIHAGTAMLLRRDDGFWYSIRIESADSGKRLFAHFDDVEGPSLRAELDPWRHVLTWPRGKR